LEAVPEIFAFVAASRLRRYAGSEHDGQQFECNGKQFEHDG